MYIDNFAQSEMNSRLQINDFIGNYAPRQPQYEVFQDELNSNNSNMSVSRGSAFDRSWPLNFIFTIIQKYFKNGFAYWTQRQGFRHHRSWYSQRLFSTPNEGISPLIQNYDDKIWNLDGEKLLAIGGEHSDILVFGDYIQKNLAFLQYKNGHKLSTDDTAQFIRSEFA